METKMIIGIDHGNRNMKTANTVFSAAIQPLQARPDSLEHILEYQNQFYYVGGKVPEKECVDKTENENYYLLTLAALAQEMRFRGLTDASVKMGAALPPRRFQQQKESFKKYLLKTKELHFRYEGVHYHVSLENVFVFMQGHVVIHTLLEAVPGYCLLVDIGGGTTDLVEFVDGMPDGKYSISDKAALYCIGKVNEEAIAKTGAGVPAYITEAFMRTGSYDCPKQYQDVIKNCLKSYAEEIYGIIQANHYNLDLTKMVFMGGGSSIVEHFGANEGNLSYPSVEKRGRVQEHGELCPTLTTSNGIHRLESLFRIRRLTPLECFRLMGFSDADFWKAKEAGISKSQLYKQAGNSIVVDVLYYIFLELYKAMPYLFEDIRLSSFFSGIGAFEKALERLEEQVNQ